MNEDTVGEENENSEIYYMAEERRPARLDRVSLRITMLVLEERLVGFEEKLKKLSRELEKWQG